MLSPILAALWTDPTTLVVAGVAAVVGMLALIELAGLRIIPNDQVGIVEKLWSSKGSVTEGRIIALYGEAGYQVDLLRGGFHFGLWRWKYRIHKVGLVTVPQGQIGYVYARDGEPLPPSQTLGRVVPCNNFQDARTFLIGAPLPASAPTASRHSSRSASAAGSARSSAKASTRSTWPCSSSSPRTWSTACRPPAAARWRCSRS